MTFGTIQYKHTNTEADAALHALVEQKFASLEKFVTEDAFCEVEFEKVAPHQSGEVFRVEANLSMKGELYRAEATEESFEKAIDEVRAELDKVLRRAHDKKHSLLKKGGRMLKDMLRFGR